MLSLEDPDFISLFGLMHLVSYRQCNYSLLYIPRLSQEDQNFLFEEERCKRTHIKGMDEILSLKDDDEVEDEE